MYTNLGRLEHPNPDQPLSEKARKLYRKADAAYGQPLPAFADVRERSRIQQLNERAMVAVILGNKEDFKEHFTKGALGSKAINSDVRLLEVRNAWRAACKRWKGEDDVQKMDELLD